MKRLHSLHQLILQLEELLTTRIQIEEQQCAIAFEHQLAKTSQKISLAEKHIDVKNTRSHKSSEVH